MESIEGRVIALESERPIENIHVIAFSIDLSKQANMASASMHLLKSDQIKQLWTHKQSSRLGSVLTDKQGGFKLAFPQTKQFNPNQISNIYLCFLAPEDAAQQGIAAQNLQDRIIHVSNPIRLGDGLSEAVLIRIPQEKLKAFQLLSQKVPSNKTQFHSGSFLSKISQATAEQVEIAAATASLLKDKRVNAVKYIQQGENVIRQLIKKERSRDNEVVTSPTISLRAKMNNVIDDQLAFIRHKKEPLIYFFNEDQANQIGIDSKDSEVILQKHEQNLDKIRIRSLYDWCQSQNKQSTRAGGFTETTHTTTTDTSTGDSSISRREANQLLRSKTIGQLQDLHNYSDKPLNGRIDPLGLTDKINNLRLSSGPADIASYHDFNSLQIAFKSVWEKVYDDQLDADGAELYESWVQVRSYLGLDAPNESIVNEFQSLKDFIKAVERDYSAAVGLSERTGTLPDWQGTPGPDWVFVPGMPHPMPRNMFRNRGSVTSSTSGSTSNRRTSGAVVMRRPGDPVSAEATSPITASGYQGSEQQHDHLLARVGRLLSGIGERLSKPYSFDVFAPNSFNFGLLVTYRQQWQPEDYQVGELVSTMPLAPGEQRQFSVKNVVKKTRSQKEIENALSAHNNESSSTARADLEIVQRASSDTNFNQSVQGNFSMGEFMRITSTTQFGTRQQNESQRRKKAFRENVRKASQQFKQERKLEISTSDSVETTTTQSGNIQNPNNEITVTYLFYELQRRYTVSEKLHRVRPVIMVAQDVPRPDNIDEDWIIAHEWILRRVLLDDSLQAGLDFACDKMAGEEVSTAVLKASWQRNLTVVEQLSRQLDARSNLRDDVRSRIIQLLQGVEEDKTAQDVAAAIFSGGLSLLFNGGGDGQATSLAATKEAAERELEFSESEFNDVESRMRTAISALEASTDKYVKALNDQMNHRTAIDKLKIHIKDNILYYMQAIWSHEPTDQRFFRLYDLPIEWVELEKQVAGIKEVQYNPAHKITNGGELFRRISFAKKERHFNVHFNPELKRSSQTRQLVEVADLDNLIGFKGNYMLFPLKESNALVDYMLQDYQDNDWVGVLDPDDLGNFTKEELAFFKQTIEADDTISAETKQSALDWIAQYTAQAQDEETIIVPTGQVYIEALPGSHAVLEDYKLLHRAIDVKKAEATVRQFELENIRKATRLVNGDTEDPDIDKQVVINSDVPINVERD